MATWPIIPPRRINYSEYAPQVSHPVIALSPDILQNHSGKEAIMKNRKYPRLKHHNYRANGAYFITLVCYRRAPLFGQFIAAELCLTLLGDYVIKTWRALPQRDSSITLDAFVLMPNHLHGIIWLNESAQRTLLNIVNWFKAEITRETGIKVWQRSFYDRVIRDERELLAFRKYIENNPKQWEWDRLYVNG
ncbi:transposase [Pantoea sp. SOD02]|uniref:transposase n=1 Tax=Pantoea sp. SOD02 TaxID=2970818 RepID=UPI002157A5E4|nr:transposase [Pantoea sp. SOD02]UVC27962.1 hypothetical protein NR302_11845 [Pantoea sp. SOD02]